MTDVLTDETGDVIITNNDLATGFSDLQHQEHLLIAQKGELKEEPLVGVGIENAINDTAIEQLLVDIKQEFTKDGMQVNALNYSEQTGDLNYDATYNS